MAKVIAICGKICSVKTTVSKELFKQLGKDCMLHGLTKYYKGTKEK